jgi:hypothetical protein
MHYSALVITIEIPSDGDLESIMKKYAEDNLKYDEDGNFIGERPILLMITTKLAADITGK